MFPVPLADDNPMFGLSFVQSYLTPEGGVGVKLTVTLSPLQESMGAIGLTKGLLIVKSFVAGIPNPHSFFACKVMVLSLGGVE